MKVIIVGGGVIGCSIAYHLAKKGADAVVVDAGKIGGEASSVAAGILTVVTDNPVFDALAAMSLKSLAMFPDFVREIEEASGIATGFRRAPLMRLAGSAEGARNLRKTLEFCRVAGVHAEWLDSASAVNGEESGLRFTGYGAVLAPGEAQITSPAYVQALFKAGERSGIKFMENNPVYGIEESGGRVRGVRLASGALEGDEVVLASGAWSKSVAKLCRAHVPVEPVKGQIHHAQVRAELLRHIVYLGSNYLCQRPGDEFLLGTTFERAGFSRGVNERASSELLDWACELLPALSHVEFKKTTVNFRPATPDEKPILGPAPGLTGLWVAAGHYRKGIILSPWTGRWMAEALVQGKLPEELDPFKPGRFSS